MSQFCGKCDFFDHIDGLSDERLKKMKVYIGDTLVKTDTEKDRALYYPFLIGFGGFNGDGDTLHLTSNSFITAEERDHLNYFLENMNKAYRRCKRNKTPFTYEKAIETIFLFDEHCYEEPLHELYERVSKSRKANIDGIHIEGGMTAYYRNLWLNELVRVGWSHEEAEKWIDEH